MKNNYHKVDTMFYLWKR